MDRYDVSEDGVNPHAGALAAMPEVWRRLLDSHVDDGHGRCVACRNSSTAGVPWPCTLRVIAEDAAGIYNDEQAAIPRELAG
ncbi:hypothetical protein GCM10023321_42050 [Pseudonocardia eucalypti]|uniref:Uncharacterized protein n=1 Tax=Pseudonocardia eucalypti TaxID=648755 RepID=A0ABP9QDD0_9PSEU|nr:hypothetical protein [Pseudonocardia eucalypti]